VRYLLRALNVGGLDLGGLDQLTAGVCRIWTSRYTPTATELVLPDMCELSSLIQWCKAVGLPEQCIEVRVPQDHQQSEELQRIAEEHGLPAQAIRSTSRLRLTQDRLRGLARQRVGFLLRENPLGPLTGMNQFHRVMFTLSTYLQTLEAGA
jgi:hypothetical protein